MLKKILSLLIIIIAALIFSGCFEDNIIVSAEYELIRIHIRADSNDEEDQKVKLLVRDEVTKYLNDELSDVTDRESAYSGLSKRKSAIKKLCDQALMDSGFDYGSTVKLTNEYFPTREYEGITVESGYYDALIIELGSGNGDNWWCVIYPPLCYLEAECGSGFRYKSKLKELKDKYFGD